MNLRTELEPRLDIADKLYPDVLALLKDYEGTNDQELAEKLSEITGNIISEEDLSRDWLDDLWDTPSRETMAYFFALPNPTKADNFSYEECLEIVKRTYENFHNLDYNKSMAVEEFYLQVLDRNTAYPVISDMFSLRRLRDMELKSTPETIAHITNVLWNYKPVLL